MFKRLRKLHKQLNQLGKVLIHRAFQLLLGILQLFPDGDALRAVLFALSPPPLGKGAILRNYQESALWFLSFFGLFVFLRLLRPVRPLSFIFFSFYSFVYPSIEDIQLHIKDIAQDD